MNDFDGKWGSLESRMKLVPGKEMLSVLNGHLQSTLKTAFSTATLVDSFNKQEVWPFLSNVLTKLDEMRKVDIPDQAALSFEEP